MCTNLSVLAKIKEVISAADSKAGPSKLYKEYITTADNDDERMCPHDLKQVSTRKLFLLQTISLIYGPCFGYHHHM